MAKIKIISIVIPIFNERENIATLYEQIDETLKKMPYRYEIIAINDGSDDGSAELLDQIKKKNKEIRVIHLVCNFGQTAAIMAGFDNAKGDVIVPIDADLQNDPKDIPKLLAKLEEGYDVVSGWRKNRKDHVLKRNFLSNIANKIISKVSGVKLHDYGCTLKAYRRSAVEFVKLYGEMHRLIPIYANSSGAKVTEIPVAHHKRKYGKSKYGMERIFKVLLDLLVIRFLSSYLKKPIYLFGGIGIILMMGSFLAFFFALYLKYFQSVSLIQTPLPLFSAMTFITSIMCFLMGILAEMIMRTYFESQNKKSYIIKQI